MTREDDVDVVLDEQMLHRFHHFFSPRIFLVRLKGVVQGHVAGHKHPWSDGPIDALQFFLDELVLEESTSVLEKEDNMIKRAAPKV
eukprot:CAMPEP_0195525244 /NCGR_PEP_ID=MMETSP0794_2-20130614/25581_1 /TAXON_ID=515487 /ORGANISM="Stephanopyxis turris, Strain CCMP 815" /LENGTH=85 /DNA_ID=CAMNT_0040655655 /DNA_START=308 /DNA_END=566 /DNA_ORIENTATION=+